MLYGIAGGEQEREAEDGADQPEGLPQDRIFRGGDIAEIVAMVGPDVGPRAEEEVEQPAEEQYAAGPGEDAATGSMAGVGHATGYWVWPPAQREK